MFAQDQRMTVYLVPDLSSTFQLNIVCVEEMVKFVFYVTKCGVLVYYFWHFQSVLYFYINKKILLMAFDSISCIDGLLYPLGVFAWRYELSWIVLFGERSDLLRLHGICPSEVYLLSLCLYGERLLCFGVLSFRNLTGEAVRFVSWKVDGNFNTDWLCFLFDF